MYIKYDEYELLELFENEPILVCGEEAGVFMYSNVDKCNVKIVMLFSVYENTCKVSLCHASHNDKTIFECNIVDVERLECSKSTMKIVKIGGAVPISISFDPNYAINIENL
ncbi:hypothetical protein [Sporomusa acidovorans]|uniref:Uncharacterized protein n=1 Tax=Sporomusa acidovorans (strain ATCC 49682 / DSM 3132 / Mol) TaxID=1123286 RepID=A0ABZ3J649_SPOA4|nr:hypothetical protein [Sporomusa acidovorans]OZC24013.1 hypothetical protein SPACI_03160 [Sporomusa acidovorans DSM 3132]SDF57356.1 hypothetical protein SAMN04488499_105912 [Sporomusa acidovorans]